MNNKVFIIKLGIMLSLLVLGYQFYNYHFGSFSDNDMREIKKKIVIRKLPKIEYNEQAVDRLYNSISLKENFEKSQSGSTKLNK